VRRWEGAGRAPRSRVARSTASAAASATSSSPWWRPTEIPLPMWVPDPSEARALTVSQHEVASDQVAMPVVEATAASPQASP